MFSLRIGDCSAKVDIINDLLNKLLPKTAQNTPVVDLPASTTTSAYGDIPQTSAAYTSASQLTPAFPSPAPSFASSLFSPSSLFSSSESMFPKGGLLSPKSAQLLSPRSFKSPSSPFFQAISVSVRIYTNNFKINSGYLGFYAAASSHSPPAICEVDRPQKYGEIYEAGQFMMLICNSQKS